jgi:hypothetical protein
MEPNDGRKDPSTPHSKPDLAREVENLIEFSDDSFDYDDHSDTNFSSLRAGIRAMNLSEGVEEAEHNVGRELVRFNNSELNCAEAQPSAQNAFVVAGSIRIDGDAETADPSDREEQEERQVQVQVQVQD